MVDRVNHMAQTCAITAFMVNLVTNMICTYRVNFVADIQLLFVSVQRQRFQLNSINNSSDFFISTFLYFVSTYM